MEIEVIEKNNAELVIYESADGKVKLDVNLENETVWLSANQMALILKVSCLVLMI